MNQKIPSPVPQTRPCAWVVDFYRTTYTDTKSAGTLDQSEGCRDGPAAGEHVIDNQHTFVRLDCLGGRRCLLDLLRPRRTSGGTSAWKRRPTAGELRGLRAASERRAAQLKQRDIVRR